MQRAAGVGQCLVGNAGSAAFSRSPSRIGCFAVVLLHEVQTTFAKVHPSKRRESGMKAAWAKDVIRMVVIGLAGFTGTASAVGPQGTYTDWWLPNLPAEGFFNIDGYITPVNEPTVGPGQVQFAYFYSSQFGIVDGDGGYIGIQTDGNGKRAIFSIWGANGAQCADVAGAICQPFTGEGDGYQTLVPYEWVPGHRYRTRV
jgi:hypothetical protein